jgi:hypothetical protein
MLLRLHGRRPFENVGGRAVHRIGRCVVELAGDKALHAGEIIGASQVT